MGHRICQVFGGMRVQRPKGERKNNEKTPKSLKS